MLFNLCTFFFFFNHSNPHKVEKGEVEMKTCVCVLLGRSHIEHKDDTAEEQGHLLGPRHARVISTHD